MDENIHHGNPQKSELSIKDLYIVARATRKVGLEPNVKHGNSTASYESCSNQNQHCEINEVLKNVSESTSSQQKTRLPFNMIVSKTATRNTFQKNNVDQLTDFNLPNVRKIKVPKPSWKEKEVSRKRLQSALFCNRQKIEEIQAMKAKLKRPRYDPGYLPRLRHHDSQQMPSESITDPTGKLPEGRIPQLFGCANSSPLSDVVEDQSFTRMSNKDNCFFSSTPDGTSAYNKFVWNPVILQNENSFGSATELLKHHYSTPVESRTRPSDSPGNWTISSTSSGVTVEETFRLTYYAERDRVPLTNHGQACEINNASSEAFVTSQEKWLPRSCKRDYFNCFEE